MSNALLIVLSFLVTLSVIAALLWPGIRIAADPVVAEADSPPDHLHAARADFDHMLVGKGLVTTGELELIRHGTRALGVVTARHLTGGRREDHHEVEVDLMVRTADGRQFPAHETTWISASALDNVSPGSVVDAYHRPGDRSAVAVHVPPR